jgi:hypothetical protein
MLKEMSYREYHDWQVFYAQCGGYPHELEDIRWARQAMIMAIPPKGRKFTIDDFLFINKQMEALPLDQQEMLTEPSQEAVDFVNNIVSAA